MLKEHLKENSLRNVTKKNLFMTYSAILGYMLGYCHWSQFLVLPPYSKHFIDITIQPR